MEILDQTVPAHHWEHWGEIPQTAAEGAARRYTAYYPDCRSVSIGGETEAVIPVRGPAQPTQVWSNPGYDPELPSDFRHYLLPDNTVLRMYPRTAYRCNSTTGAPPCLPTKSNPAGQ